jgi:DNA (cytosine-5)-methyltransferase 3A
VQLGSVVGLTPPDNIDLLIGGSPCQDLSIAKKDRKGLDGDRSGLFWEYVRIKEECKPTYFLLENVASMPKKDRDIITITLGVQPVLFNASLVSAQCRKRLFWTNLKFELPEDRGILLRDILQPDGEVDERMMVDGKSYCLTATYQGATESNSVERKQRTMVKLAKPKENEFIQIGYFGAENHCKVGGQALRVYDDSGKSTTSGIGLYQTTDRIRKLTPIECERLQSLPDNYTEGITKTNRYKCLGNAFNVDVVSHILSSISNG